MGLSPRDASSLSAISKTWFAAVAGTMAGVLVRSSTLASSVMDASPAEGAAEGSFSNARCGFKVVEIPLSTAETPATGKDEGTVDIKRACKLSKNMSSRAMSGERANLILRAAHLQTQSPEACTVPV
jgi:hypothetical protein